MILIAKIIILRAKLYKITTVKNLLNANYGGKIVSYDWLLRDKQSLIQ